MKYLALIKFLTKITVQGDTNLKVTTLSSLINLVILEKNNPLPADQVCSGTLAFG